jgi:hypothetical protein
MYLVREAAARPADEECLAAEVEVSGHDDPLLLNRQSPDLLIAGSSEFALRHIEHVMALMSE